MNAATTTPRAPVGADWLFGRQSDLLWLVGGVLASFVLLAAYGVLHVDVVAVWWAWILLLDGPHVFATWSRTYFDAGERAARARLLVGSLAWFAVGPALFLASYALRTRLPVGLFFAFAGVWAYWHVVRQHYGVVMLYKRKNGDVARVDAWVDGFAVYGGQLAPFVAFALTHPEARAMLGITKPSALFGLIAGAAWGVFALAVVVFAVRQLVRAARGEGTNVPKALTIVTVLSLAAILFSPPVASRLPFLMFFVLVTAFHNVQYQAIVWFYHRRRIASNSTRGLATRIASTFGIYALAGVVFTFLYRGLGCALGAHPGCTAFAPTLPLPGGLRATDLPQAIMWGFALHHYYLDQKIWRPSRDAGLRRDLTLESETVAVGVPTARRLER